MTGLIETLDKDRTEKEKTLNKPIASPLRRDPKTGRMLPRQTVQHALPGEEEAIDVVAVDLSVPPEPDEAPESPDPHENTEAEEEEIPDETVPARQTGIAKVQALLTEALRLGQEYHLIERQPDGTLLLAGQTPLRQRASSDCACPQCHPWAQQHWWCVVCGSGPHDWHLLKPQFERQTLKAGGIEGTRQAACSAQCARDFLQRLGRQPAGLPSSQQIDPTLGLPG
jgi:hypothetical protein